MKRADQIKVKTEVNLNHSGHRENEQAKLLNSQAKIKAFVSSYSDFGDYNNSDFGETLSSCFSFFRKLRVRNPDFYQYLLEDIKIQKYAKGQVLTLFNESAETAIFILEGKAGVYTKGTMSPQRAKGYKQEYGQQFYLEIMNPISKRKSNLIQQQNSALNLLQRRQKQHSKIFTSEQQIKQWFPQLFKASYLSDLDTIDQSALKKNIVRSATIIAETPMIIVALNKQQFKQKTFKYDNLAVQTDQKLEILRNFGLFRAWDTKLNNLIMYFQKKRYKRGNTIYNQGDSPNGLYLILSGQVQLSYHKQKPILKSEDEDNQQKNGIATIDVIKVDVQILGKGTYFGQIEMLKKTDRKCTAKCSTAVVEVFYLNKKNFFLLGYQTDLFYLLKQKLPLRQMHKLTQQQNALKIKTKNKVPKKQYTGSVDFSSLVTSNVSRKSTFSKINNYQPMESRAKFYHGNIVYDTSNMKTGKAPYFSMLQSNKQMYNETVKKFRRFNKQTKIPYKPNVDWDMKRVWKVLKLDDVLEQQSQLANNKDGLEYFYKHQRLQNQIIESKSIRPRTSSCSYQDKVKYIRYLDNFGRSFNRKFSMMK